MTPTEQWILCLALVYAVPSFLCGVGITVLFVRWQDIRRAFRTPGFPALPWQRYEATPELTPTDEGYLLPEGLRLL